MNQPRKEIVDLLVEMNSDLLKAAKVLFPEIFYAPFDKIHTDIRNVIQSPAQKKALAAPRGIGKTSIANLVLPTVKALLGGKRYIVPISATADLAQQQAENLKYALTHNENIIRLFGDISTQTWSKDQWVINTPEHQCCIFPRGAGQQIRGQNWRGKRPDLIIFDDFEKTTEVNNERIREEKWKWVNADVLKSIDPRSRDWEVVFIGTILHHDSILQRILLSDDWVTGRFEICDDEFNSNAPSLYSKEELMEMYQKHIDQNILDVFYREMRNIPAASGEHAAFQSKHFQYYDPEELRGRMRGLETLIIVDPAKSTNMKSADSAIVVITLDMQKHCIYIRDVINGKFHPDELYAHMARCIQHYRASLCALEVTGLHEFVMYPMKNYMRQRGIFIEFMELQARGGVDEKGKAARVRSLSPLYREGLIYHNKRTCSVLEGQLLEFPNARRWDVMDATGYVTEVLEKAERYMQWHMEDTREGKMTTEQLDLEFAELLDEEIPRDREAWRRV